MTTWSYAQLEDIWVRNGGSAAMAPLMAAVAEVESSGNDQATNPSGATGLWQMEWPLYAGFVSGASSRDAYLNPDLNARAAVKLSQNNPSTAPGSPVYNNWLRWHPSPDYYKRFLQSGPLPAGGTSADVTTENVDLASTVGLTGSKMRGVLGALLLVGGGLVAATGVIILVAYGLRASGAQRAFRDAARPVVGTARFIRGRRPERPEPPSGREAYDRIPEGA